MSQPTKRRLGIWGILAMGFVLGYIAASSNDQLLKPVAAQDVKKIESGQAKAAAVGDTVIAYWKPDDTYFVGTAVEKTDTGFLIVFEDGDTAVVPAAKIRKYDLKVGDAVIARWSDGGYYQGKIAKVVGRAFYIHYDDGDKGWAPWSWIAVK